VGIFGQLSFATFCRAKLSAFSQRIINNADSRFVLAIVCYYFYIFVARIWQIQLNAFYLSYKQYKSEPIVKMQIEL